MDFLTVLFFVLSLISSLLTGRFAGAANILPEASESLPEVQVVCPRRRELP